MLKLDILTENQEFLRVDLKDSEAKNHGLLVKFAQQGVRLEQMTSNNEILKLDEELKTREIEKLKENTQSTGPAISALGKGSLIKAEHLIPSNLKNLMSIKKEKKLCQELADVVSVENNFPLTPTPNRNLAEKIRPESDMDESCQQNYLDSGDYRKIESY